jgi:hypothetical protein
VAISKGKQKADTWRICPKEEMQAKQRGSAPRLPICDSRPHPSGREKRS